MTTTPNQPDREREAQSVPADLQGPRTADYEAAQRSANDAVMARDADLAQGALKPFAYFQWNDGWDLWEQVADEHWDAHDGIIAAYRTPEAALAFRDADRAGEGEWDLAGVLGLVRLYCKTPQQAEHLENAIRAALSTPATPLLDDETVERKP